MGTRNLLVDRRKNRVTQQVPRAPLSHLPNDGQQALAYSSQSVLDLWRHDLVFGPLDETQRRQGNQIALAQVYPDVLRSSQFSFDPVEPGNALFHGSPRIHTIIFVPTCQGAYRRVSYSA